MVKITIKFEDKGVSTTNIRALLEFVVHNSLIMLDKGETLRELHMHTLPSVKIKVKRKAEEPADALCNG